MRTTVQLQLELSNSIVNYPTFHETLQLLNFSKKKNIKLYLSHVPSLTLKI